MRAITLKHGALFRPPPIRLTLTSMSLLALMAWLTVSGGGAQGENDPAATPDGSQSSSDLGLTRASPALPGEETISNGYGVTLLGAIQGPEAAQRLSNAGTLRPASHTDEEYVLAEVRVRNTLASIARLSVSPANFGLTASAARLYPALAIDVPGGTIGGSIEPGGERTGWVALPVSTGETGRQLVFLPGAGDRTADFRYMAIDVRTDLASPVASPSSVSPATPLATPLAEGEGAADGVGLSRDDAAPPGTVIAAGPFLIELLEIERGEGAAIRVRDADTFNPAPLPGNDFAIASVTITSTSTDESPLNVSSADFTLIGAANVPYAPAPITAPRPSLEAWLFPGGAAQGYIVFELPASDQDLTLTLCPTCEPHLRPAIFPRRTG